MPRLALAALSLAVAVPAQNLIPDGHFDQGATIWTMTSFNDPLGTTGFGLARVTGNGPSNAVFANFQTLSPVMSATYRGQPFAVSGTTPLPVGFHVMWEKQVTTPIPSVTVNRVELRIFDFTTNTSVYTGTQNAPNQSGLQERATFTATWTPPAAGVYVAELFLRHSNLAGIPFTTWVDDAFVGEPNTFHYGQGCAGSGGFTPLSDAVNQPVIGSTNFAIELQEAAPTTAALFVLGFSNTNYGGLPLPFALGGGCSLLTSVEFQTVSVTTGGGPGTGMASQPLPIPNLPGLQGMRLYSQWGVVDPAAPNPYGLVLTAGLGFVVH